MKDVFCRPLSTDTDREDLHFDHSCMYVSDNSSCWLIPFTGFSLININPITCGMEFGVNVQGEGGNYTKKVNSEVNALGNK